MEQPPREPDRAPEPPAAAEVEGRHTAPAFTPGGLPLRVPQANLAPALKEEPPPVRTADEHDDDERSPEEIRAMMGSLQSGTRLGRSDAARLMGEQRPGGDA